MLDLMYELPSLKDVKDCLITRTSSSNMRPPFLTYRSEEEVPWDKPGLAVQS